MKWFCVLILCLIAPAVLGQPAQVSRVLRKIDFEERRLGNDEDLPMHWTKVEATGFPHYVNGRLTKDQAHGGEYSFRFDLDGGSLLYRYDAHQIPVQTGATYVIEGYVQTTPMKYARARISAYFIDIDGHPLPKTVTHSETYAAANDNDPWKQLTLRLTSHDPSAAYLVLELGLLQPQVYAGETLGDRTVHAQDIHGTAWFDDITISQVPEVVISTDKPGNLFHFSDPMAVMMNIDDAFMADLQVQMFIHDADGRLVYQRSNGMESLETRSIAANHKLAILPVPAVPPGWYEISLLTSSQGRALSTQSVDIVRLPDDQRDTPLDKHFGLIATDLPYSAWNQLPDLVSELGCGRIKLGLWSSNTDPQHMDSAALNDMINRFTDLHITPTACLLDLPPALSNEMDQSSGATPAAGANRAGMSWLRLLHSPDDSWQPPLEYLIARHADHVDRWQIGADGSDIFATQPGMRQVYAKLQSKFNGLITHADVAMPWPAWAEFDGQPPSSSLAMAIPSSVLPSELPLYVQDLKPGKDRRVSLSFQMLDRARYGRDVQLRDLAERVIYALSAGVDRIDLPSPFTAMDTESSAMQPLDLFVPMRSMLSMLSQARYLGKVPIAEGIEAFLFDRHGQGMVALWDTGRTGGVKPLAINLGDQPRLFTLWGSEIPLVRPADDPVSGAVQLSVGPTPEFLLNIDASLAQLRASVRSRSPYPLHQYISDRHQRLAAFDPAAGLEDHAVGAEFFSEPRRNTGPRGRHRISVQLSRRQQDDFGPIQYSR